MEWLILTYALPQKEKAMSHVAGKPVCGSVTREGTNQPAELQRLVSLF